MEKIWVYLDDARPLPAGYDKLVRTAEEAIELIKAGVVAHISLDNDLSTGYTEEKRVAQYIETAYLTGEIDFVRFHPHTSNPVAFDEIMACKRTVIKHAKEIKDI